MKAISKNVAAVFGFKAVGKHIGVKKGKKDLAVIYSSKPCTAAGVFSQNKVKAAPIEVTKSHLKSGKVRAIVINSGVANVSTGKAGMQDAENTAKLAAKELKVRPREVLVSSTGVIGKKMPMDSIKKGLVGIKKQLSKEHHAAEAILTTDTIKKELAFKCDNFKIGAIAKGSGMIHPNMATMLCFITTDADLTQKQLKTYLKQAVDDSFNMLSIDMDVSTSDMVLILTNNRRKVNKKKFQDALTHVCTEMAKMIAIDGEGATKRLEVEVKGATSKDDAKKLAKSVVSSNLVKCAAFGNDPNWGRIMAAIGSTDANFKEEKVSIYMQDILLVKGGIEVANFDEKKTSNLLKADVVTITINLNLGKEKAVAYGCDMSYDYVKVNSHYTT